MTVAFNLIDINQDGSITKDGTTCAIVFTLLEMRKVVTAMHKVLESMNVPLPVGVDEYTNQIFTKLDTDKNGSISLEEYMKGALEEPLLLQGYVISIN